MRHFKSFLKYGACAAAAFIALAPEAFAASAPKAKTANDAVVAADENGNPPIFNLYVFYDSPATVQTGRRPSRIRNMIDRWQDDVQGIEKDYNTFKTKLNQDYGIQYSADVSFLAQKGVPNGGKTAMQTIYAPTASWRIFDTDKYGSGTITASYTAVRYWGNNANNVADKLYLANPINDYSTKANEFNELNYTQTLFGNHLTVVLGQYSLYDLDGSQYNSNQQINFINYALAQNATATYADAGLGAYVQYNPVTSLAIAAGFQDATNINARGISVSNLHKKKFTTFGEVTFMPEIADIGQGQYSVMVYNQPSVDEQPENTTGWTVNLSQFFSKKLGVFARANGVTGKVTPIKQSYTLGMVYNNPFNRSALDQIGLSGAFNRVNKGYYEGESTRRYESVVEGYYTFGVTQFLAITPDVQVYVHPAEREGRKFGTVFSLRATLLF